jgi:DNA polymerase-3 subunit chi
VTEIDFHFNAPDKVSHTCRLLRKAVVARGSRLVVTGEGRMLDAVDTALWQMAPSDFVAHCRRNAQLHVAHRSPVLLTDDTDDVLAQQRPVLVNLGAERFERLIEIVTGDESDRQSARQRWRHYADRGYALKRYDLAAERN